MEKKNNSFVSQLVINSKQLIDKGDIRWLSTAPIIFIIILLLLLYI